MKFIKNYKLFLILLVVIIIGGCIGFGMGEKVSIFEFFGNLFLNLIFIILILVVFFSILLVIVNMNSLRKLGKILGVIIIVFGVIVIVLGIIGVISFKLFDLIKGLNFFVFNGIMSGYKLEVIESIGILEKIVLSIIVGDFF